MCSSGLKCWDLGVPFLQILYYQTREDHVYKKKAKFNEHQVPNNHVNLRETINNANERAIKNPCPSYNVYVGHNIFHHIFSEDYYVRLKTYMHLSGTMNYSTEVHTV